MKRLLTLCFIAAGLMVARPAQAQHDVKFNFLGFLFNNYGVGYEYVLGEEMSAGAFVNYSNLTITSTTTTYDTAGNAIDSQEEYKFTGFNIMPNFRFYFTPDDDCEGYFVEGYLRFRRLKSTNWELTLGEDTDGDGFDDDFTTYNYDRTRTGLAIGIAGGRKWVTNAGFFFETLFGIGKYMIDGMKYSEEPVQEYYDNQDDVADINLGALDFRLALSIGWRFGG